MKDNMKTWKIIIGVCAGVLAAAATVLLVIKNLEKIKECMNQVKTLIKGTETEVDYVETPSIAEEPAAEEEAPAEEAAEEAVEEAVEEIKEEAAE